MSRPAVLFLILSLVAGGAGAPAADPTVADVYFFGQLNGSRAEITPESILNLLYQGRAGSALARADSLVKRRPEDPLSYLVKARVLREMLLEMDDNKSLIRLDAAPIHVQLDRVLELCEHHQSARVSPKRQLYEGWAWMFKAQLHALGKSYWSSGRAAARGHKKLKAYLKKNPDDADARGIMGTFMYFADTLPATIKIAKKLLLIPGGDRRKGLDYLRYASEQTSLLRTDHRIIRTSVLLIFEGRFEDGIREYISLLSEYPEHLRLTELPGIIVTFNPVNQRTLRQLEAATVTAHSRHQGSDIDSNTLIRLRYHRAYADKFYQPARAAEEFAALIKERPDRPDWVMPMSLINLGCLKANSGETEAAAGLFGRVLTDDRWDFFHGHAEKLRARHANAANLHLADHGRMVGSVYTIDTGSARSGLGEYEQRVGRNIVYDFYSGEIELLRGNHEAAAGFYGRTLALELPVCSQGYQMIAAARLAEIAGARGDYEAAEKFLERALKYYQKEFLADMLIEARKRYYHRLAEGELDTPPTLLKPLAAWPDVAGADLPRQ